MRKDIILFDAVYKLWDKMNRMGIHKKDLKDKKIVSGATINKMKNNEIVTMESIDKLCEFFSASQKKSWNLFQIHKLISRTKIEVLLMNRKPV